MIYDLFRIYFGFILDFFMIYDLFLIYFGFVKHYICTRFVFVICPSFNLRFSQVPLFCMDPCGPSVKRKKFPNSEEGCTY